MFREVRKIIICSEYKNRIFLLRISEDYRSEYTGMKEKYLDSKISTCVEVQ